MSARAYLLLCSLLLSAATASFGQDEQVEVDSIVRDSMMRIVQAESISALVPAEYAALIIDVNDKYSPEIQAADQLIFSSDLNAIRREIEELARLTRYVLNRNQILENIQSLETKWLDQLNEVSDFADALEARTNAVIDLKKEMTERRSDWLSKRDALEYAENPDQIDAYVEESLDTLAFFMDASAAVIDTFTVIYTNVVDLMLLSRRNADDLKDIRQSRVATVLRERNEVIWKAPPLFETERLREFITYLRTTGVTDTQYYVREHRSEILKAGLSFFIILFLFYWTRRRSRLLEDEMEPELVRNVHVLEQPFTMSVFGFLLLAGLILPNIPPLVSYLFTFVLLLCIFLILSKMMKGREAWIGYTLAGLFLISEANEFLLGGDIELRWLTVLVSLVVIYLMAWVIRHRRRLREEQDRSGWYRIFIVLSVPIFILSMVALVGGIIGYSRLATLINDGAIRILIIGLLLLSMFKSLMSVIYHFFHTNLATKSNIINEDGLRLFNFIRRFVRFILLLLYLRYALTFFLLWEPISDFLKEIWELGYAFGKVILTVGDVINVILIIFGFWFVAGLLRVFLVKEVFDRVNLPRGVGNAVASMTQYLLVVVGVFLALAAAGFDASHLGILAGALGVGIGFGLQNIVNNFLSGLILVFERPVAVDDVIEVDGVLGKVTGIGIRSSKIRQFNGDEVIVPNGDLISKRVTNRTLSDTKRRYTMEFETNRGIDPDRVIQIVTEAASGCEGILEDPPVKGYFRGLGPQSVHFYINYWGSGNFLDLQSDVEKAVYVALERNGIEMPVPLQKQIDIQVDD